VKLPGGSALPALPMYNLRHSCGTLLLTAGEDLKVVSERLGHSTIKLTADTYIDALPERQQAATDRMQRLFG
jgi:integrase